MLYTSMYYKGMLMYIACLCPNLVSVHFYAIPILHFKFPKFFIYLYNIARTSLSATHNDLKVHAEVSENGTTVIGVTSQNEGVANPFPNS